MNDQSRYNTRFVNKIIGEPRWFFSDRNRSIFRLPPDLEFLYGIFRTVTAQEADRLGWRMFS